MIKTWLQLKAQHKENDRFSSYCFYGRLKVLRDKDSSQNRNFLFECARGSVYQNKQDFKIQFKPTAGKGADKGLFDDDAMLIETANCLSRKKFLAAGDTGESFLLFTLLKAHVNTIC